MKPAEAITELRPGMAILQRWRDEDHEEAITLTRDDVIALIEEGRNLVPATDDRLAEAAAYHRAAQAAATYCWNRYASKAEGGRLSSPAVFTSHTHQDIAAAILALADTDTLAEVQALRAEVQALRDELDITDRMLLAEAKQSLDRLARADAEHARGDRLADKLVAAEAQADAAVTALGEVANFMPDEDAHPLAVIMQMAGIARAALSDINGAKP